MMQIVCSHYGKNFPMSYDRTLLCDIKSYIIERKWKMGTAFIFFLIWWLVFDGCD